LYIDTDSLIMDIKSDDFYNDVKNSLIKYFDTSDDPKGNPYELPLVNCEDTHIVISFPRPVLRQRARQHTLSPSLQSFSLGNPFPLTAPNQVQLPITAPQHEYSFHKPHLHNLPTNQWQGRSTA